VNKNKLNLYRSLVWTKGRAFCLNRKVMVVAIILAGGLGYGAGHDNSGPSVHRPNRVVACEEDQPCWDCTTMGNRKCGS
jgi:hypothetical protein